MTGDPILTLTVNPAIDRIFTVDRLVFEDGEPAISCPLPKQPEAGV